MSEYTAPWRCTAQNRKGNFCDAASMDDVPWPVCSHHAVQLFIRMKEMVDAAQVSGSVPGEATVKPKRARVK